MTQISYRNLHFPPSIVQRAVCMYVRFNLSLRDVEELLAEHGIEVSYETIRTGSLFIQPGKPKQNAYVEPYNRTVRYDWLNQYLFKTIGEVQEATTAWLWTYNNECPNMALGGITPKQKLATGMTMAA